MKILFRILTLVIAGLLIFSFGNSRQTETSLEKNDDLTMHISTVQDTLKVLEQKIATVEIDYFDSLVDVKKERLADLQAGLEDAGLAEIYVAHQVCESIEQWVGLTLKSIEPDTE